ncbi:GntR family transcriptional regulator [Paracoccus pacificus]|uniref:GntR family transcriptional regulator n=1 Tax=Paracoccus pacificus TaxID=1463598 RepID=A0ABW4R5D0_9RHOB
MNLTAISGTQLRRRSLHEELIEALRELIVSGELPPGRKVPEKDLCDLYGVSRTPLREALKVLATDGLVTLEPNRGAWVTQITVQDLDEVFPVMGALEALAGELACQNITDKEIKAIRSLHDRMVGHYEARELDAYFALNQRIHEAILAAARNDTLATQYRSLATRVRRARYVANMTPERWRRATEEHIAIMECLEARDGQALSVILKRHLENKRETVRDWLKSQEAGAVPE